MLNILKKKTKKEINNSVVDSSISNDFPNQKLPYNNQYYLESNNNQDSVHSVSKTNSHNNNIAMRDDKFNDHYDPNYDAKNYHQRGSHNSNLKEENLGENLNSFKNDDTGISNPKEALLKIYKVSNSTKEMLEKISLVDFKTSFEQISKQLKSMIELSLSSTKINQQVLINFEKIVSNPGGLSSEDDFNNLIEFVEEKMNSLEVSLNEKIETKLNSISQDISKNFELLNFKVDFISNNNKKQNAPINEHEEYSLKEVHIKTLKWLLTQYYVFQSDVSNSSKEEVLNYLNNLNIINLDWRNDITEDKESYLVYWLDEEHAEKARALIGRWEFWKQSKLSKTTIKKETSVEKTETPKKEEVVVPTKKVVSISSPSKLTTAKKKSTTSK